MHRITHMELFYVKLFQRRREVRCINFLSGSFHAQTWWSTIEKEAFAIYWALGKLDDLLGGIAFTITFRKRDQSRTYWYEGGWWHQGPFGNTSTSLCTVKASYSRQKRSHNPSHEVTYIRMVEAEEREIIESVQEIDLCPYVETTYQVGNSVLRR